MHMEGGWDAETLESSVEDGSDVEGTIAGRDEVPAMEVEWCRVASEVNCVGRELGETSGERGPLLVEGILDKYSH